MGRGRRQRGEGGEEQMLTEAVWAVLPDSEGDHITERSAEHVSSVSGRSSL